MRLIAISATVLALTLTACGGGDSDDSGNDDSDNSVFGNAAEGGEAEDEGSVEVLEAGFGQTKESPQYVNAGVVVKGDEGASGRFVVVTMNFLDEAGETIITAEQTESFSWPDQELIVPVSADLGSDDVKVASVEATAILSNEGGTEGDPIPDPEPAVVKPAEYGSGTSAKFTFANPTDEDLSSPRIGVLCRNEAGEIVGAGLDFPSVIPAGGEIVTAIDVSTNGVAASCEATMNYGY